MIARTPRLVGALAFASLFALTGCARGCTSSRPPIHPNPSMDDQPKVLPQTASDFFYDGASMRLLVPGTVPIGDGARSADPIRRCQIPTSCQPPNL